MPRDPEELLTPSEAALVLRLSADTVRVLSDKGKLPTLKTMSGRRLFRREDVERLAAERSARAAGGAAHAEERGEGAAGEGPVS